jgi:hypothetical protein
LELKVPYSERYHEHCLPISFPLPFGFSQTAESPSWLPLFSASKPADPAFPTLPRLLHEWNIFL